MLITQRRYIMWSLQAVDDVGCGLGVVNDDEHNLFS